MMSRALHSSLLVVFLVNLVVAALAQLPPPDERSTAQSRPASQRAKKPGEFQPGIVIDWKTQTVRVSGRVAVADGPIEFIACFPGKEHESLILLDASPTHVVMALGLAGIDPGKPPRWDEEKQCAIAATGQPVQLTIEWQRDGQPQTTPAFAWVTELEYARPAVDRPMVFSASIQRPDGRVAAEISGAGAALVDMPDAVLSLSRSHSERNSEAWATARGEATPPAGTSVTLVLSAAQPMKVIAQMDERGLIWCNRRLIDADDLADLIDLSRRIDKSAVATVQLETPLLCEETRLRRTLASALREDYAAAVKFERVATTRRATIRP